MDNKLPGKIRSENSSSSTELRLVEHNRVSWQTVWIQMIQDTVTLKKFMVDHLPISSHIFPFGHMVFVGHSKGLPKKPRRKPDRFIANGGPHIQSAGFSLGGISKPGHFLEAPKCPSDETGRDLRDLLRSDLDVIFEEFPGHEHLYGNLP